MYQYGRDRPVTWCADAAFMQTEIDTLAEVDAEETDETNKAVKEVIADIPLTDPKGG